MPNLRSLQFRAAVLSNDNGGYSLADHGKRVWIFTKPPVMMAVGINKSW